MKKRFWITFFIAIIGFSVLFAGIGRYILSENSVASGEDVEEIEDFEEENLDDGEDIIFLLMGIDENEGVEKVKKKKIKKGEYVSTGYRSDTMMLCKYSFETGSIDILSIPRDSKVDIRGRKNQEKINHAYSHGGPYLAMKTVKDLLNIDLNYFVTVDYLAVKEVVDDIDGVDIDVPVNMKYTDTTDNPPLYIDLAAGYQNLNGKEALEYLRFRTYPDGDIGRVHAQQLFMREFMDQTLKPKNILKLPRMAKTYYNYVYTNIPFGAILKGVGSVNKLDVENLNIATIPGESEYIGGLWYFIYEEEEMRKITEDMFSDFLIGK